MKKKILSLLLVLALMMSVVGCQKAEEKDVPSQKVETKAEEKPAEAPQEEEKSEEEPVADDYYPVTITTYNYNGEAIEETFEKAPEKVIAIYQSSLENMLALGLGDRIIYSAGLDVDVKAEWQDELAKIGTLADKAPDKEAVLDMEPDMIVSWSSYFGEKKLGDVDFWHERDIKTYIMQNSGIKRPNKLEYEYEDIMNLGIIFNKVDEAKALIDAMQSDIEAAQDYTKDKEKVKTVIMEVEKENQFRNYGGDSIGGNIAELAGADLVIPLNGSFGPEELIENDPDVIFTVYFDDTILEDESVKLITENPALQSLSAIKNGRVHAIMLSEVYASGVRTADGIKSIVSGLYPELAK
ncbi:MAG: ABC transporter substrate-binding protein [Tissierellia bacterium]|nr:ABC transporter substrate-binding protein [Tissierellia bacterium]